MVIREPTKKMDGNSGTKKKVIPELTKKRDGMVILEPTKRRDEMVIPEPIKKRMGW